MKVSDYIVEYFINKEITDIFGYPGGMVTHLMESFRKYSNKLNAHVMYHEQAAAFAACGYAQTSGKTGVAYATSGPGATNLITGIGNAFFDSIPVVFITGQVNTFESKEEYKIRQRGFQETDIVSMVKPITKKAIYVEDANRIREYLDEAFSIANQGRKGPVLLDIPMNVLRAEVNESFPECGKYDEKSQAEIENNETLQVLISAFENANRPCLILGNGIKASPNYRELKEIVKTLGIPVVSSMIAMDVLPECELYYGFIGAYGNRTANFIVAKSDLIITVGTRLDIRQVGAKRECFAAGAKIIRFDIDMNELEYKLHDDEVQICTNIDATINLLKEIAIQKEYDEWREICKKIKKQLNGYDDKIANIFIKNISDDLPEDAVITTDVGQNQVWVAQSLQVKQKQKVLFSGGHGAMGYSLPAAIGACYANDHRTTICFTGDGGVQMNIQELQYIAREKLPVKIIVFNNNSLGMIRHFQEMYFEGQYFQTKPDGGYEAPCFAKVANAYGIKSLILNVDEEIDLKGIIENDEPYLIEVEICEDTYVFPKLEYGKPNQDQEPLLNRDLYNYLMSL